TPASVAGALVLCELVEEPEYRTRRRRPRIPLVPDNNSVGPPPPADFELIHSLLFGRQEATLAPVALPQKVKRLVAVGGPPLHQVRCQRRTGRQQERQR